MIEVTKPTREQLTALNIHRWPIWTKEASVFDWHYDQEEKCYLLEGDVEVDLLDGRTVRFGAGDFVVFPQGLSCRWHIKKAVKKHYCFQ